MDATDLANRFTYHAPKNGLVERYQRVRDAVHEVAKLINDECPESREKLLAVTHLEDALMWANAAIARHE